MLPRRDRAAQIRDELVTLRAKAAEGSISKSQFVLLTARLTAELERTRKRQQTVAIT